MKIELNIEWIGEDEYSLLISNPVLGSEQSDICLDDIKKVVREYFDLRREKITEILKGE